MYFTHSVGLVARGCEGFSTRAGGVSVVGRCEYGLGVDGCPQFVARPVEGGCIVCSRWSDSDTRMLQLSSLAVDIRDVSARDLSDAFESLVILSVRLRTTW